MNRKNMRKLLAVVTSLTLVAAACGGDDDDAVQETATTAAAEEPADDAPAEEPADDAPAEEPADDAPAEEPADDAPAEEPADDGSPTTLRVTSLGLCNEINMFWAIERGFFEEQNLNVELVRSTGGSAGLAAVIGGSADLAFANTLSSILAYTQGFPIKYVASLYHSPVAPAPVVNALIVQADSDIQGPEDLIGARIGVNELGGINQLVTQNYLRKNGVDPTEVNFVALPFPELAPAVVAGRIDAAQVPTSTAISVGDEVRSIADPYREGPGELVFAGFLVTDEFEAENRDALQRFQQALLDALEDFRDDPERFDVMAANCPTPVEALRTLPETAYAVQVDMELLQTSVDVLLEEGQLREAPDIEGLVPEWARTSD